LSGVINDAEINKESVRSLLREQHADLSELRLRRAAVGWDNQLWRLGDELAVRLPHATERASSLLRKEYRWLPVPAPGLPLPVPALLRTGEPSAGFPKPWTIAAWVPDEPGDRAGISRGHHAAGALAGFLRALHHLAPSAVPVNPRRSVPLASLTHEFEERFRAVAHSGVTPAVRDVWDEAVSAPLREDAQVRVHGDLHPANVVVLDGGARRSDRLR
jgi:aminoglycoside phosphotransferase (APT) family kinase protein